jgi:hypothetical protein
MESPDDMSDAMLEQKRQQLSAMMSTQTMDGAELRRLVFDKWSRSYDVRLQKRGSKMFVHVMWKFLEQRSFHLTDEEYQAQLDAGVQNAAADLPFCRTATNLLVPSSRCSCGVHHHVGSGADGAGGHRRGEVRARPHDWRRREGVSNSARRRRERRGEERRVEQLLSTA